MTCEHKFVHYETNKYKKYMNDKPYDEYKRIDLFYCEKCLEYTQKITEQNSKHVPDWY